MQHKISKAMLKRLSLYLVELKQLDSDSSPYISASAIAERLGLNEVQVRKDLASVSSGGKPKLGFSVRELISSIESKLGCNDINNAVIVGAGKLGQALMKYEGFIQYGLNIVAAFDIDPKIISPENKIYPMKDLKEMCRQMNIHIGIITVPGQYAQEVCNMLTEDGVIAILNFAPVTLSVPSGTLLQNENMALSLAVLSNSLKERINI